MERKLGIETLEQMQTLRYGKKPLPARA